MWLREFRSHIYTWQTFRYCTPRLYYEALCLIEDNRTNKTTTTKTRTQKQTKGNLLDGGKNKTSAKLSCVYYTFSKPAKSVTFSEDKTLHRGKQ